MVVRTKCQYCGKEIKVNVPKEIVKKIGADNLGCSCNNCIPVNSAARDGINESIYTEVSGNVKGDAFALIAASIVLFISMFTLNKWALFAGLTSYVIVVAYCFSKMFRNSISYNEKSANCSFIIPIVTVLGTFGIVCCLGSILFM